MAELPPPSCWACRKCRRSSFPSLSEDQVRAYILADNRLAEEKAGWDDSILAIELQHLLTVNLDFDVTCTGFEVPEIDLILQEAAAKPSAEDIFEHAGSESPVSRPGDLWILGKHRVLCGNSLDEACYAKLMNGRIADAIFVDPPFNVPIHGHVSGNGSIQHREFQMASGEMSEEEFIEFLNSSLGLLARFEQNRLRALRLHGLAAHRRTADCWGTNIDALLNLCIWAKGGEEWIALPVTA